MLSEQPEDEPRQDIVIRVEGGIVIGITINEEAVRATVHDYDVQYPVEKYKLEQDEEGRDYIPMIV